MYDFKIQPKIDELSSHRNNNLKRLAGVTRIRKNSWREEEKDKNKIKKVKGIDDFAALLKKSNADKSINLII